MIAADLYRTEVLALNNSTPRSVFPHLIASRTYNVRGIVIVRSVPVAKVYFLEHLFPMCLYSCGIRGWERSRRVLARQDKS